MGSIALDSIETPFGKVENVLGGSASYGSAAASLFAPVDLVGVVGRDFPDEFLEQLGQRADTRGLQVVDGSTFRWSGRYDYELNTTETIDTQLNVFGEFHPTLPTGYENAPIVFLGNIHPDLQLEVLEQCSDAEIRLIDTFELWINTTRQELIRTMKMVDVVSINEAEARLFAKMSSLRGAAREILDLGPKVVLIKQGEYGAVMFGNSSYHVAPAYPLDEVKDPTGAGDSFAGGFLGHLARTGDFSEKNMHKAMVYGSAVASHTVSGFSVAALQTLTMEQIERRYNELVEITHFDS